jgi:hypothetical protein
MFQGKTGSSFRGVSMVAILHRSRNLVLHVQEWPSVFLSPMRHADTNGQLRTTLPGGRQQ